MVERFLDMEEVVSPILTAGTISNDLLATVSHCFRSMFVSHLKWYKPLIVGYLKTLDVKPRWFDSTAPQWSREAISDVAFV